MTTPWSDTPPSEPGEWWVRRRSDGTTLRLTLLPDGYWITSPYMVKSGRVAEQFQFGPRVLDAEDTINLTAEVERLRAENRILNERYDLLEQENDGLRRNGVVIYVGSEELDQLRAAAAELAEIKRAWGMAAKDL